MCLTTVTSTEIEDIEGEGWKVVSDPCRQANCFTFPYQGDRYHPYDQWLERKFLYNNPSFNIIGEDGTKYPAGFHVFTTKEDAEDYGFGMPNCWSFPLSAIVVKVKYKTILAKGIQGKLPCIVTQFLYVEKPECA
jgi:hypothetical protein